MMWLPLTGDIQFSDRRGLFIQQIRCASVMLTWCLLEIYALMEAKNSGQK